LPYIPSMVMAYIAFGGGERRIIEFEASQRSSIERSREDAIERSRDGKTDSNKTSKQKRQQANRKAKKFMSK